jgi:hypothetical protein
MPQADKPSDQQPPGDQDQANPVIRLVRGPNGTPWNILSCGIDKLDVGFTVKVKNSDENSFFDFLLELREKARESKSRKADFYDPTFPGTVGTRGKGEIYQVRLSVPNFAEIFFRTDAPLEGTANVYVSFAAEALWLGPGIKPLVEKVSAWFDELGFAVEEVKPSRVDPCMDIFIPGGLTQHLMDCHLCTDAAEDKIIRSYREASGFCFGSRKSPIFTRIYDKTREIHEQSEKWWFHDIWKHPHREYVWRFEFELKREFLRELRPPCDTIDALLAALPHIWAHLTGTYLTFRAANGNRTARRDILPVSRVMCDTGFRLLGGMGEHAPLDRTRGRHGSWEHAVRDLLRMYVRACALTGIDLPHQAMSLLIDDTMSRLDEEKFRKDVATKRRDYGFGPDGSPLYPEGRP